jgi:hypothetical protein
MAAALPPRGDSIVDKPNAELLADQFAARVVPERIFVNVHFDWTVPVRKEKVDRPPLSL